MASDSAHVGAGRQDLAADQGRARHRQAQQGFERSPFALARGRIDGQVQASHQHRKQHEIRHEPQHHHGAAGGRRHVDLVDRDRHREQRTDPADLQAQLRDTAAVAREQSAHTIRALARLRIRAVGDQQQRRGYRRGESRRVLRRHDQDHGARAAAHRRARGIFGQRRGGELHALGFQVALKVGGALAAGNGDLKRLVRLDHALIEHPRDHRAEQQRAEQRTEQQRRHDGAPIAQVLQELLAEHREQGAHQSGPSASPSTCRNASSSEPAPLRSRIDCSVPCASTRPRPMITT